MCIFAIYAYLHNTLRLRGYNVFTLNAFIKIRICYKKHNAQGLLTPTVGLPAMCKIKYHRLLIDQFANIPLSVFFFQEFSYFSCRNSLFYKMQFLIYFVILQIKINNFIRIKTQVVGVDCISYINTICISYGINSNLTSNHEVQRPISKSNRMYYSVLFPKQHRIWNFDRSPCKTSL